LKPGSRSGIACFRISHLKANHSVSWQYTLEANIAYAVSWFPYMGAWNRFAKTERGTFWGAWLGLSFIAMLFAIVGGIATFTTGSGDPSVWATKSGLGFPRSPSSSCPPS